MRIRLLDDWPVADVMHWVMLMPHYELCISTMITEFSPAQTSVPEWLMTYCRQLSDVHYSRKLNRMYVHMLESFLVYEPWKANPPFEWRVARSHRAAGAYGNALGWLPMNMLLPNALIARIKEALEHINGAAGGPARAVSIRTFLYTAVCWWVTAVFPYEGPGLLNS